ncbi:hypothetical protein Vadar_031177 [Vaccinium darrowii]|uniref:Uncharacterized protein n=1 Tax=Vaccinium darrowii TaxID=229202 RepID=A0ACB7XVA7_9ERIC|nr:hypothetical protein Vadar_031177 [Vaccinium darrowii]
MKEKGYEVCVVTILLTYLVMSAMNESNSIQETPPSSTAFLVEAPTSSALFPISSPSFDAISFLTAFAMVDEDTIFSLYSHVFTGRPTFKISVTRKAFLGWSECMGQAAMGALIVILSKHEFQPQ